MRQPADAARELNGRDARSRRPRLSSCRLLRVAAFAGDEGLGRRIMEHLQVLDVVPAHRRERDIGVLETLRITFNPHVNPADIEIEPAPLHSLAHRLKGITRVEFPHRLDWPGRPPITAKLETERSGLERMDLLDPERTHEPGDKHECVRGPALLRHEPTQDRLYVVVSVVGVPRAVIGALPFL